ncbi:MAG: hypothetical protein NZM40_05040 [Sphingomonadaceae bacterium]|uniref:hypothetical protein n=1 Tax=Thermaurantiacus sp. TaxID=2820283 RepID=UPI00298EDFCF|nr:hypothetical protein [Thermaurantiacus sp.]MCS6986783.1 hypothetical protein [Sphingomonadaceae bacterium]MDW8413954.1 hypothetical protein [Thermaurantiacus sp.]
MTPDVAALEAEARAARAAVRGAAQRLARRLDPAELARTLVSRARDAAMAEARMAAAEAGRWLGANAWLLAALAATLGAAAALGHRLTRRPRVPIEEAYHTEDPAMHEIEGTEGDAPRAWDRIRDGAEELTQKAGETLSQARTKAAELTATARARASEVADEARAAGERAAAWAKRQPQEHPMTSVIIGFALGAILAALLPRGGRRHG